MTDLPTEFTQEPEEPAKLRIYLGAAPGVGKTFQMLEDAHLLKKQGVDIVIGLIESHGRIDTEAQIKDIEVIPRRATTYRSVTLTEMDRRRHPRAASQNLHRG